MKKIAKGKSKLLLPRKAYDYLNKANIEKIEITKLVSKTIFLITEEKLERKLASLWSS